jgi:DNA-binding GntR family transcriptional regulator
MSAIDVANRELHFQLYGMPAGLILPALSATLVQHWERFSRYRQIYWAIDGQVLTRSIPDHEHIVEAWKRRDSDAAEREIARHILEAVVSLIHRLEPGRRVSPALAHLAVRYDLDVDL